MADADVGYYWDLPKDLAAAVFYHVDQLMLSGVGSAWETEFPAQGPVYQLDEVIMPFDISCTG